MEWLQNYDPLGNPWLSTIVAALPVVILLGLIASGFENDQDFGAGFKLALPPVMRLDLRDEIGASGEAILEHDRDHFA